MTSKQADDQDATRRIPSYAGFRSATGKCRWCERDLPPKRTFCSEKERDCIHQHKIRTQPAYATKCVLERDHGICKACGRDVASLHRELSELALNRARELVAREGYWCWHMRGSRKKRHRPCPVGSCLRSAAANRLYQDGCLPFIGAEMKQAGIPEGFGRRYPLRRLWEMDHIVPVVEGGGNCGLENYQTLCWRCHRADTAALAARRARARKPQRELNLERSS